MATDNRISLLLEQLSDAQARISKAQRSVERAERKLENVEYERDCIIDEIDRVLIGAWGNTPDWKIMLEDSSKHSTAMYDYANELLRGMGLSSASTHMGTGQRGITLYFQTTAEAELERVDNAVRFILRHLLPWKGRKSLNIANLREDDCAYSLSVCEGNARSAPEYVVEKMTWGTVDHAQPFGSLREALQYIQSEVCDTDLVPDDEYLKLARE